MVQKCDYALLFKLHNRVWVPNACWWKMIEGGWSSLLWKYLMKYKNNNKKECWIYFFEIN
jgi:hypothetical protein